MPSYSTLPNKVISVPNGVDYTFRDAGEGEVPLVLLQHFRGNLDNWDPALVDGMANARRVIAFDNVGVGGLDRDDTGHRGADGPRRHRLHRRPRLQPG